MRRTLNIFVVETWCISHLCSSSAILKFVENQKDAKKQFYCETTMMSFSRVHHNISTQKTGREFNLMSAKLLN